MSLMAARSGDSTAHGGTITFGAQTVTIGGQPAARLGDTHACPVTGPGVPPHVGGIVNSGSATVTIGGSPAARVTDTALCNGPLDVITVGCRTVVIGGPSVQAGGGSGSTGDDAEGRRIQGEIDRIDARLESIRRQKELNDHVATSAPDGSASMNRADEVWWQTVLRFLGTVGSSQDPAPDYAEPLAGDMVRSTMRERNETLDQEAGELRTRRSGLVRQRDQAPGGAGGEGSG